MNLTKYLLFTVSNEIYAIPIIAVREIIRFEKLTIVRDSQSYLKGVINLRGKIIPVIDMRIKFGMSEQEYGDRTVFIIVDINGEKETYNIGIAVDNVMEVVDVEDTGIEKAPEVGLKLKGNYLAGIAKINNDIVMILNMDKVINTDEIIQLENTTKNLM